jgi:hypothetical protein
VTATLERGILATADRRLRMIELTTLTKRSSDLLCIQDGYVPVMAVIDLPSDVDEACSLLASRAQFEPLRDGSMTATLDLPPGVWRFWPRHRIAIWLGRHGDSYPSVRANARLDLYELIIRLARRGYLLRDLKTLGPDGWSPRRRGGAALQVLGSDATISAVRGVWADPAGRAIRLEVHTSGLMAAQRGETIWNLAEAVGAALNA